MSDLHQLPLPPQARQRLRTLGYRDAAALALAASEPAAERALARALGLSAADALRLGASLQAARPALPKSPPPALGLDLDALERHQAKALPWRPGPELAALRVPPRASLLPRFQGRPARNQGERGTCVAFASCAAVEASEPDAPLSSPQQLYWHMKQREGFPQRDGSYARVALDVLEAVGVCRDETWPYDPLRTEGTLRPVEGPEPGPAAKREAMENRRGRGLLVSTIRWYPELHLAAGPDPAKGFWEDLAELLRQLTEEAEPVPCTAGLQLLKAAVSGALGPAPCGAIGCFAVYESSFAAARVGGRMTLPLPGERRVGGHAMAVVGYGDDADYPGGGYLLVRNSWGPGWPQHSPDGSGVARLPYAYAAGHLWELGIPLRQGDDARLRISVHREPESAPPAGAAPTPPCTACGARLPAGARFCGECGAPQSLPSPCAGCGATPPAGARFCAQCGQPVAPGREPAPAPPSEAPPAAGVRRLQSRHAARMARLQARLDPSRKS